MEIADDGQRMYKERTSKEDCLWLAEYNFCNGEEYRMWQWLLEWVTWDENLNCTITKEYVEFNNFMEKVLGAVK